MSNHKFAIEERRRQVALAGGLARALDKEGLSAAGKLGGDKIKEIHGVTFFSQLGTKGGSAVKEL